MNAFRQIVGCTLAIALLGVTGCSSSSSDNSNSGGGTNMDALAGAVDAQNAAAKKKDEAAAAKAAEDQKAAAAEAEKNPPPPQIENVTAHSMKQGKSLEGKGGYLRAVVGARFWAEHQLILDNILHAMQLYQAEKGYYPKTQDQFMKEIIEPNEPATKLPELPEGWEYYYDPKEPLQLKMINKGTGNPTAVE